LGVHLPLNDLRHRRHRVSNSPSSVFPNLADLLDFFSEEDLCRV
jgi:hypothetical protein